MGECSIVDLVVPGMLTLGFMALIGILVMVVYRGTKR